MKLRARVAKASGGGVHREVAAAETLQRLLPCLGRAGITRLADITGLDRVGIPVYAAVAPRSPDIVSVYNGKGPTAPDARVGAVAEAMERRAAAAPRRPAAMARYADVAGARPAVDPRDVSLELHPDYGDESRISWVDGFDLMNEETVLVPLFLAGYYPLGFFERPCFRLASTNGLASGNSLEEAVCHALCEVIERDAWTLAHLTGHAFGGALARGALGGGPADPAAAARFGDRHPGIDADSLPEPARGLAERFRQAGLALRLRDITSDVRVPSVLCVVEDDAAEGLSRTHLGAGTHPDAVVAAVRALSEAAQSRAVDIQGVREDVSPAGARVDRALLHVRRSAGADPQGWYGRAPARAVRLAALPTREHDDVMDDVRHMLEMLRAAGIGRAIAVDLSPPDLPLKVVRLIVPGLESWAVDRSRFGARASSAWNAALSEWRASRPSGPAAGDAGARAVAAADGAEERRSDGTLQRPPSPAARPAGGVSPASEPARPAPAPSVAPGAARSAPSSRGRPGFMAGAAVFTGPSLDPAAARAILPAARVLPPVRRGDVDALLAGDPVPGFIGVVDGQFLQNLAISPKELLRAVDRGVRVFGAASMGALRAVELAPHGMVGVGRIFELFRTGVLDADDEVAVVYDPDTLRPLCEPLVNVRLAVDQAVAEGVVAAEVGRRFVAAAKALYFPRRRYDAVLEALRPGTDPEAHARLAAFLRERAPDAKRDDALAMLRRMRAEMEAAGFPPG